MNTPVRRKLEMVARVRTFSRTHPSDEPTYAAVLARLEEGLARAEAIATRRMKDGSPRAARGPAGRSSGAPYTPSSSAISWRSAR